MAAAAAATADTDPADTPAGKRWWCGGLLDGFMLSVFRLGKGGGGRVRCWLLFVLCEVSPHLPHGLVQQFRKLLVRTT